MSSNHGGGYNEQVSHHTNPTLTEVTRKLQALDLSFRRIQFTPDLMPADITGTDVLEVDPETGHRVLTTFNAEAAGVTSDEIIRRLLTHLSPREELI